MARSTQGTKTGVKFKGGSAIEFGLIAAFGSELLLRFHSKINATVYKEVLKKHDVPNLRTAINQLALFMQDNAPSKTAKFDKIFLSEKDVYGVGCSKPRHESYWECFEVTKWNN